MLTTQEIKQKIEQINEQIKTLENVIKEHQHYMDCFEFDPDDFTDDYDDMLDDYGDFMGYSASRILKEVDPTAYRCGLLDYVDGLDQDYEKMKDAAYSWWAERKEEAEDELTELEEELSELESALEDLENEK